MFGQGLLSTGACSAAAHQAAARAPALRQLLRRPCSPACCSLALRSQDTSQASSSGRAHTLPATAAAPGAAPHHPSSRRQYARTLSLGWTCQPFRTLHSAPRLSVPPTGRDPVAAAVATSAVGSRRDGSAAAAAAETAAAIKRASRAAAGVKYSPLHHNITDFCEGIVPTAEEQQMRVAVINSIVAQVGRVFLGTSRLSTGLFGSFATGLSMWNSDIDLVVTGLFEPDRTSGGYDLQRRATVAAQLSKLAAALRRAPGLEITKLQLIRRARMPIIKMTTKGHLSVDICMADDSGVRVAKYVAAQARTYPTVVPLVLVLKTYLRSCGINDVAVGGLSSYSLTNMVIAHLQEELKAGREVNDLGEALYSFLVRYSEEFDYLRDAVSVASGGVVAKSSLGVINAGETSRLASSSYAQDGVPFQKRLLVDCPLTGRDVSNGTFRIDLVQEAFATAARKLEDMASERGTWGARNFLSALFDTQRAVRRPPVQRPRVPLPYSNESSQHHDSAGGILSVDDGSFSDDGDAPWPGQ